MSKIGLKSSAQLIECDGLSEALDESGYTLLSHVYDVHAPQFCDGSFCNDYSSIRAVIWAFLGDTFELKLPLAIPKVLSEKLDDTILEVVMGFLGGDDQK